MLTDKSNLSAAITSFSSLAKINGFTYEEFEEKAEEIERAHPGAGYQMAYNEMLVQSFKEFVDKHLSEDPPEIYFNDFVHIFDQMLMGTYLRQCKAQGIDVKIETNSVKPNVDTLVIFNKILEEHPDANVYHNVAQRFYRGELTLDSVYEDAKARAKTVPTKKEALELAARAEMIEVMNKERSFRDTLRNLFTFFKELFAISAIRKLASKAGDVTSLEHEAKYGNHGIFCIKDELENAMLKSQVTNEKEMNPGLLDELEEEQFSELWEDKDFETVIDTALKGERSNNLNESDFIIADEGDTTLDLDAFDGRLEMDDSELGDEFLSDKSMIMDDGALVLDEEDESLAEALSGAFDQSATEEKTNIVVEELAENFSTSEKSPRVEEPFAGIKEKGIE